MSAPGEVLRTKHEGPLATWLHSEALRWELCPSLQTISGTPREEGHVCQGGFPSAQPGRGPSTGCPWSGAGFQQGHRQRFLLSSLLPGILRGPVHAPLGDRPQDLPKVPLSACLFQWWVCWEQPGLLDPFGSKHPPKRGRKQQRAQKVIPEPVNDLHHSHSFHKCFPFCRI